MSESLIVREPVFIESNGQRVAVLLPIAVYESLLSGRTTSPGVPSSNASIDLENEALLREQRSFETMHSDLLARYPSQSVAILDGQVVDHDQDQYALWVRIDKAYPGIPVLIKPVLADPVERYRRRSPRLMHE